MKMKIGTRILILVIFPCLLISFGIAIFGTRILNNLATNEIKNELKAGAYGICQTVELCTDPDDMEDRMTQLRNLTEMELSITSGDIISKSTILGTEKTKIDPNIVLELQKGEDYFDTNIIIQNETYYGYYIPFFVDGKFTGAVFAGILEEKATQNANRAVYNLLFIIAAITIIGTLLTMWQIKSIITSTNSSKSIVDELSNNNLVIDFDERYRGNKNEIEEIYNKIFLFANQLNTIIENIKSSSNFLNNIATVLKDSTNTTNTIANDISKAVTEVANGAAEQANDTQNITEKISVMGTNIENVGFSTNALLNSSTNMAETKDKSMSAIKSLEDINLSIMDDITEMNDQINITNDSVGKIQQFIDIIKGIASQTNLLSLNASIEAARAGETGKGFAVVAGEISKLAKQSNTSSEEIAVTVQELLNNYERIIDEMLSMTKNLHLQSDKIGDTKKLFLELENNINEALVQISSINSAIEVLDKERIDIVDSVCNLSAISEENSASAEETMASIQELSSIISEVFEKAQNVQNSSNQLLVSVNVFNTAETNN